MRPDDPAEVPLEPVAPRPAVAEQPAETLPRRRSHLVVVVTRAVDASEASASARSIAPLSAANPVRWRARQS